MRWLWTTKWNIKMVLLINTNTSGYSFWESNGALKRTLTEKWIRHRRFSTFFSFASRITFYALTLEDQVIYESGLSQLHDKTYIFVLGIWRCDIALVGETWLFEYFGFSIITFYALTLEDQVKYKNDSSKHYDKTYIFVLGIQRCDIESVDENLNFSIFLFFNNNFACVDFGRPTIIVMLCASSTRSFLSKK